MADEKLFNAVLSKSMALCANREYCRSEIRQKIESWGAGPKDTEKILVYLVKEKFIDEERYSQAFVKDKFKYNKWGKVKISAMLKQKGIPEAIISQSLETIEDESYTELLRNLLTKHRKTIKARNQFDLKGKLMRFGLSKGFETHLLYDILNDFE